LQFLVSGASGGAWSLHISPYGSQACEGRSPHPHMTLWTESGDTLCQLFTGQINISHALWQRKLFIRGDLLLAARLPMLFSPT
jgi:hypothetical protein